MNLSCGASFKNVEKELTLRSISMLDAYSWAWKINLVEKGMSDASILLSTYESERKGIAEALLRFDAEYSR